MGLKKKAVYLFSVLILSLNVAIPTLTTVAETITIDEATSSGTFSENEIPSNTSEKISENPLDESSQSNTNSESSSMTNDSNSTIDSSIVEESTEESIEYEEKVLLDETIFPDENFRNFLIENFDRDHDGFFDEDPAKITELNLSNLEISSLSGIEIFKNLITLDISKNLIEEIDLSPFVQLEQLDISGNKIVSIDLSKNIKLTKFNGGTQTTLINAEQKDDLYIIDLSEIFSDEIPDYELIDLQWRLQDGSTKEFVSANLSPLNLAIAVKNFNSNLDIQTYHFTLKIAVESKQMITRSKENNEKPSISYQSYLENDSWQSVKSNGEISGTTGQAKKITGFKILKTGLKNPESISYRGHFQSTGWGNWSSTSEVIGDISSTRQMESIQINSTSQDIYYRVHVRDLGWLGWAKNGETAGTTGMGLRVEAVQVTFEEPEDLSTPSLMESGTINSSYTSFVGTSWQTAVNNGTTSGTVGEKKPVQKFSMVTINDKISGSVRYSGLSQNGAWSSYVNAGQEIGVVETPLEAIKLELTGDLNKYANIYYRVHVSGLGWLSWTKNGAEAGTTGFNLAIEAIQIIVKPRRLSEPNQTGQAFVSSNTLGKTTLNLSSHSQRVGWVNTKGSKVTGGTTGRGLRLEAMQIKLENSEFDGGISYRAHVQGIGWQGYQANGALSGTTGQGKRLEALQIKLTGKAARLYDIYYRVHSQTYGWLDWAVNDQKAGTISLGKRAEAIEIQLIPKGQKAPGSTEKPFVEKSEYLFVMGHGVWDPGAVGSGTNERDFTRNELLPYLRKYAAKLKTSKINFYDTSKDMYQDTQIMGGAYLVSSKILSVTEIHLDAGGALSTGGHVIVHKDLVPSSSSIAMAETIRQHVGWHSAYTNNRGLSLRSDLLNLRVFKDRGIDYRLTELGFITNPNDVAKIRRNIDTIAKQLIQDATGERL
ncbi:MAG: N-acetylmuramoyl-L-alanine amidase [Enterococcus casseliflavus]